MENPGSDEPNPAQGVHSLASAFAPLGPNAPPSIPYFATTSADISNTTTSTLLNTPSRSIFLSGPPTSSLSVNTAQASMTATTPSSSSRPLSALTTPLSGSRRSVCANNGASSASTRSRHAPSAEKDVDDPSSTTIDTPDTAERRVSSTPNALSRLFAATGTPASMTSQNRMSSISTYTSAPTEPSPLPHHLYTRGFIDGRHSDISVHAFSTTYCLHRLLLDRSPFFSSALSEPWFDSSAKEITLHPEDIDPNITQAAFELALKRLYGLVIADEEDKEALGLLATGCWLEMSDLVDSCVESILRQMSTTTLASTIRLVTGSYYGMAGVRILTSAKAMLCRDGWKMPLRYWDGIPGDVIRDVIGGDGFFVPDEWERWGLARRVFNRKLSILARDAGIAEKPSQSKASSALANERPLARSPSPVISKDRVTSIYSNQDIQQLSVLLNEGIHYVHLSFEQLQHIRASRDSFGRPHISESVAINAVWMALELKQKVINAKEEDVELGLKRLADQTNENRDGTVGVDATGRAAGDDTHSEDDRVVDGGWSDTEEDFDDPRPYRWDGTGLLRKFWIPSADSTTILGDSGDPNDMLSSALRHQRAEVKNSKSSRTTCKPSTESPPPPRYYTRYPPFRFSAEFPNPALLKENKRIFSRTLWYAGSLWKIYIQKVRSSRGASRSSGGMQLGIYLHRARERKGGEEAYGGTGIISTPGQGSVDERTANWENDTRISWRTALERRGGRQQGEDPEEESSGSGGDSNPTILSDLASFNGLLDRDASRQLRKASQTATLTLSSIPDSAYGINTGAWNTDDWDVEDDLPDLPTFSGTMPPYTDGRPNIQTYFKIYSPSKGGRMLSVYESAPDGFNFSQSWVSTFPCSISLLTHSRCMFVDDPDNDCTGLEEQHAHPR
ncbi:hypothetical protein GP486_002595 [Trichoglossum hirsutum]|uniref:BTB domain-containing protein n=1 Tax=Trichoglossum hirsutum TaxID=265104 RepID=A0A9P8LEX6_9PEZI|nr:hypothetical protein GP486_002595 [Trichoglossum hirsutum]